MLSSANTVLAGDTVDSKVICVRQRPSAAKIAWTVAVLPFRAVYYVVQGPRMMAEISAFGETGEHLARYGDNYKPGITYPGR